ncbi:MAG: cytochrome c oxidase assembly protein [Acidimicrobiia bacterium]|nr:cytochrome c oxidase assembly protein [Acidimicrobiia bacterium]
MQWWCTASSEPWSWAWTPYPGIWLSVAVVAGLYVRTWRRHRPGRPLTAAERRMPWWFASGVGLLWLVTDWPIGALGAGYLASMHMLQFMVYTLIAAPLVMIGIPSWFLDGARAKRWWPSFATLSKPVVAGITFNVVLLSTHSPFVVDLARANQLGSFAMDVVWLAAGMILWLPLLNPAHELRHPSLAVQALYLFLASGVFPMLPGAFLVFADFPMYATFELSPPVGGLDPAVDQQIAGLIMKVGNIPILWPVLGVLFFRWAMKDEESTPPRPAPEVPIPVTE